jgi:hypothetical protein
MVIRGGQVILVSCYLPLSSAEKIPKEWGTRHRAAIGITEHCDAWVIAVSEESGEISMAREGQIILVDSLKNLTQLVFEAITPLSPPKTTWTKRAVSLLTNKWQIKAACLGLVFLLWLLLAGQQDFQVNFRVPLEMKNIPIHMEIMKPHNPELQITVRGLRRDASTLSERNVHAVLDLSLARLGRKAFAITRDQILLPNDRVQVVRIEPTQLQFEFKNRP